MRKPQEYRDHAETVEDMAAGATDHLLRTNVRQLARHRRDAASEAEQRRPPAANAA